MSNKQGSNIPWWAIVLGFIVFSPLGFVLLFLNLAGVSLPFFQQSPRQTYYTSQSQTQARPSTPGAWSGSSAQTGAQGAVQGTASGTTRSYSYGGSSVGQQGQGVGGGRQRFKKPKNGKWMTILGTIFSFSSLVALVDEWSSFGVRYVGEWFPLLGLLCAGLFMMGYGISRNRLNRRQRLYLGVIGQRNSVFLSDLASSAGVSEKRVISDLQHMLAEGVLPMGYIDRASGRLVLTDQGYEAPRREEAPKKEAETAKAKEDADDAILREIRAVNDAIPGDEMSRKIDRIGEITGKILDYQRQNPSKAPELQQFLNYYLPTTLKILRAYAQMDAQGVDGENITAAKRRIEDMMDKVVEGFEKQLDQLFANDVMDITTDVEVLERMLDKDGLGSGMTSGFGG